MELIPVFQPIVDTQKRYTKQRRYPVGEVLARWVTDKQMLGPYQLPSEPDWVKTDLDVAMQVKRSLNACGLMFSTISLNVSEATMESDIAFKRWIDVVYSITSKRLVNVIVEVTEGVSEPVLQKRWPALSRLGAAVALDDYGDAGSTFSRLTAREWDYCKFSSKRMALDDDLDALALCQEMGIKTIVEQVEDLTQSVNSHAIGLTLQQGYYHGRPALLTQHLEELKTSHENNHYERPQFYLGSCR